MKIINIVKLVNVNNTYDDHRVQSVLDMIKESITQMEHPIGSGAFHLNLTKKGNGVKQIKDTFFSSLKSDSWQLEHRLDLSITRRRPGPIDATYNLGDDSGKYIAVEWETGNIASSHRSVNKLVSGLLRKKLLCGVLILPSSEMYKYLTDRVGNFNELEPYFQVWNQANYDIDEGCIIIIEIEHDVLTSNVPRILKGTDGRALK